jgi:queuine tRNA-ribosyltransferase
MKFTVTHRDGAARTGVLELAHGRVETPAFMPVGTYGTVKAMSPEELVAMDAQIVLGNTFHLWLRPGTEVIEKHGGLHRFMGWNGPILTDSGGFQVFSLETLRKLSEEGVRFASPVNGDPLLLTPEESMRIQKALNSDVVMVFDECTPYPATEREARQSMELSLRWAERSRRAHEGNPNALFGIVQGSVYDNLRNESLAKLLEIGFDGYAIGGLAIGEGQATTFTMVEATVPYLPRDRPRYLMGVGKPADIVGAVKRGVDMFDCVLPTRSGRTGQAFTRTGTLNLRNARHAEDPAPLDAECRCPACTGFSRAYLHHLTKAGEILGSMLLTTHNLTYYADLTKALRAAIRAGRVDAFESGGAVA